MILRMTLLHRLTILQQIEFMSAASTATSIIIRFANGRKKFTPRMKYGFPQKKKLKHLDMYRVRYADRKWGSASECRSYRGSSPAS